MVTLGIGNRARALRPAAVSALGAVLVAAGLSTAPEPARAGPPPEGRCPRFSAAPSAGEGQDEGAPLIEPGMLLGLRDLLSLRDLLPHEIWKAREVFFFEGMRMEIGACHRRYAPSAFYAEATERFAGTARIDDDGNLHDYVAGLPFPPDAIDMEAPDAALKWAWNFQHRYRGSGPVGRFRILDLPSRLGQPQTYIGDFFILRTGHRADLAMSDYRMPEATKTTWVSGGRFDEPFSARHLAWRQMRPRDAERDWKEPDDTFVYVPTMRKSRRAASAWVDGVYTPRYRVSGDDGGGPVPFVTGGGSVDGLAPPQIDSIQPTAGLSIAATEDIRRGFTGLALRPNAYDWELLGEQEVIAPLNGATAGWPVYDDRNYGPSGLSVASDRWDVRWAVVIRGRARRVVDDVAAVELWIDHQTAQPLYMITRRKRGFPLDVGILVHRYSGDRAYEDFPGGERANVFDPVAAAFYFVPGGGSGWRRESYGVRSLPPDPDDLRKMTSTSELLKGH